MNSFELTKESIPGFVAETQSDLNATLEWVKWNMGVTELTAEQTTEVTEVFNSQAQ